MSKIAKTMIWLLEHPTVVLILFYAYWLISIPTQALVWGAILLSAYLLLVILSELANKNRSFLVMGLMIALPAIALPLPYIIWAISLAIDYGSESFIAGVVLLTGIIVMLVSAYKKISGSNTLEAKLIFVCTLPLMLLNIFYIFFFYPKIEDTAIFQGNRYHIVSQTDDDFHSYQTLYKCNLFGFYCEGLYSSLGYVDARIIADNQQNEISLFEKSGLRYTNGLQPRYYEGYPVRSGNHMYELGWSCDQGLPLDCDQVGYVLYQCSLDYTGCKSLPIKYTSYYDDYSLELGNNEETGEILLFDSSEDPPILIFTYGEQPRCFVKGCEFLKSR